MRVFARYLAFQTASWALGVAVLGWLAHAELLQTWLAITLFGALVLKDLVLFPITRKAYEHGPEHGAVELLGAEVLVETALAPDGYVRAGPERWRARLSGEGSLPLAEGEVARVRELRGLTLIVERLERVE
ncbi:MAG: NfeD family protein [Deltaproteobacteria bacterium]|nr:NfeD family protein [Deltaproteobacteria bacterium]